MADTQPSTPLAPLAIRPRSRAVPNGKRRLTREQGAAVDRRIAELCAHGTSGLELTATINQEMGLQLNRGSYADRVRKLGLAWIPAERRPRIPDLPEAELPICRYCGQVRRPMLYAIESERRKGQQTLLCEKRCCPTCGAKLEVHSAGRRGGGSHKYWTHASPMPLRNCAVCGKEFQPENILRKGHKMTCSDRCGKLFGGRNWKARNPQKLRQQEKRHSQRRTRLQATGRALENIVDGSKDAKLLQAIAIYLTAQPKASRAELRAIFKASPRTILRAQKAAGISRDAHRPESVSSAIVLSASK